MTPDTQDSEAVREKVREGYGAIARQGESCCGPVKSCCGGGNAEEIGRSYQTAMKALADLHPRKQSGCRLLSRL